MFAETLIPPVTVQHEHSSSLTYLFVGLHEITLSARSLEEQNNMYLDIYALILMAISHSPTPTPIPIPTGLYEFKHKCSRCIESDSESNSHTLHNLFGIRVGLASWVV